MADSSSSGSKTEKATPKKKEDARKKGNVFSSKDIPAALTIFFMFTLLRVIMPWFYSEFSGLMQRYIGGCGQITSITPGFVLETAVDLMIALAITAGPVMLASIVVNVLATGIQTKFLMSGESIKPKFSRLSPLAGIKRMFALRSLIELLKSILKAIIIGAVLFSSVQGILNQFTRMMFMDLKHSLPMMFNVIMDMVISLTLAFLLIAAADYLFQWWDYEKNLRMTKQELKEEYKSLEGDPQIKARIRDVQRKMAQRRMMQDVPTADVVVRNPTHFAIALKYDIEKDRAPVVVAKGKDHIALRIVEIAEQNDVPVTENRPLARLLYDTAPLGAEVPPESYGALAEVMAWVYTLKHDK